VWYVCQGSYVSSAWLHRVFAERVALRQGKGPRGCFGEEATPIFDLVRRVTSWACLRSLAPAPDRSSAESTYGGGGLAAEECEQVGRECKRLLDYGRVMWLREHGFEAELVHFCGSDVSPENCLLLAWPQLVYFCTCGGGGLACLSVAVRRCVWNKGMGWL